MQNGKAAGDAAARRAAHFIIIGGRAPQNRNLRAWPSEIAGWDKPLRAL
jgi:hypothetical protein